MIKDILQMTKDVFSLASQTRQNKESIKTLQEREDRRESEMRDLREENMQLTLLLQRVVLQHQQDRENAAREHENLLLRLENALLRADRTLPSTDQSLPRSTDPPDEGKL